MAQPAERRLQDGALVIYKPDLTAGGLIMGDGHAAEQGRTAIAVGTPALDSPWTAEGMDLLRGRIQPSQRDVEYRTCDRWFARPLGRCRKQAPD